MIEIFRWKRGGEFNERSKSSAYLPVSREKARDDLAKHARQSPKCSRSGRTEKAGRRRAVWWGRATFEVRGLVIPQARESSAELSKA